MSHLRVSLLLFSFVASADVLAAQTTLYVPGGTPSGIGASTTTNVGIGTNTPGVALDVIGTVRSLSGSIDVRLQAGAAGAAGLGSFSNDPVLFFVAGSEQMRI